MCGGMSTNADQYQYWNEDTERAWIDYEDHTDLLTQPLMKLRASWPPIRVRRS
jgi:hypothetical protein